MGVSTGQSSHGFQDMPPGNTVKNGISSAYTIKPHETVVNTVPGSGAYDVQLPSVEEAAGRIYTVVCVGNSTTNKVNVKQGSTVMVELSHATKSVGVLYSNGIDWFLLMSIT